MQVRVEGTEDIKRMFASLGAEGAKKALVKTINSTAYHTRMKLTAKISTVFDRPRPITKSAVVYHKALASMAKPTASVELGNNPSKTMQINHYLAAQIFGGKRDLKRSETILKQKGILPQGKITRPGPHATIDQYGNMPGSQIVQMLSQLQLFSEQGYSANATTPGTGKYRYFVKKGKGIFRRVRGATGAQEAMMFFIDSPTYKIRFDLYGVGLKEAARVLPIVANEEMDYALKHY